MSPLLEFIGTEVIGATAYADGRLVLSFSNAMTIEIFSKHGYEAWHFQFPRAGRPPGGDVAYHISLYGTDGKLV